MYIMSGHMHIHAYIYINSYTEISLLYTCILHIYRCTQIRLKVMVASHIYQVRPFICFCCLYLMLVKLCSRVCVFCYEFKNWSSYATCREKMVLYSTIKSKNLKCFIYWVSENWDGNFLRVSVNFHMLLDFTSLSDCFKCHWIRSITICSLHIWNNNLDLPCVILMLLS